MKKNNNSADKHISLPNTDNVEIEMENDAVYVENNQGLEYSQSIFRKMHNHFQEYSEKTSLHGVQYIGEKGRPRLERISWIIICVISICLCTTLIMKTWDKWNTTPVIVSFVHKPTAIWQIPFPAVTICPEIKSRETVFNFTEKLAETNRTAKEEIYLNAVSLLCTHEKYENGENLTDQSALEILAMVAPRFEDTFLQCKWHGFRVDCADLFRSVLTADGLCYNYNMLSGLDLFAENTWDKLYLNHNETSNWSIESGYSGNVDVLSEFPNRAYGVGNEGGIEILLNAYDFDYDYSCRGPTQGFKILLHNAYELPQIDKKYLVVPTNQELTIAVRPEMTTTSRKLRAYDALTRMCYFQNEKKLKFYKIYSQENCQMECIANRTLHVCGCVAFHMPLASRLSEVIGEFASDDIKQELFSSRSKCNCLPSCTSLAYNIETSQADLIWKQFPKVLPETFNNTAGVQLSRISIFYKDYYFTPSRRSELYGTTDFIANCGGLLGLFMGFSFISFIEIIYFITLRICGDMPSYRRRAWKFFQLRKSEN